MYDAYHHIALAHSEINGERKKFEIAGPVCESADFVGKNISVHEPKGDAFVIVFDVGAYCISMSGNYNLRMRPLECMVTEDLELKIIGKEEKMDDMLCRFSID